MKHIKSSVALVGLLLAVAVAPPLAAGASRLSSRSTPPAAAGLAAHRIDPPDRGVCVTRPGQPCPRPPVRVQ